MAMGDVTQNRPRGAGPRFGTVEFPLKRRISPHGQVTALSMMKDEAPYLIEWVAHHLAVGFTDLLVYTNDCSDGTDDMLIRLEELGLVHHRRNVIPEGQRPQPSALNHAQDEPVARQSDWLMVFDADEFLSIRYGDGGLDGLISAAKDRGANGIVVTWRIFGSAGVVDWSRAPVTEQYRRAAPRMWNKGWGVKTLFTFDPEHWKLGIHRPKMKNKHIETDFPDRVHWLNGSGRPMEDYFKFRGWRSITRTVGHDWVQLNHYAVKSVDSYALRKLRGNVNNKADKYNSDYWALQDRNEEPDDTMLRYAPARAAIAAGLLADPVLRGLHDAALARAEARLAELRGTPAYAALVADLARASAVPITQITAKPPQARDPEKIAALMSEVERRRGEAARAERQSSPRTPPETTPPGAYVRAPAPSGAVGWGLNQGIRLPFDPGIFTPSALALLRAGKFERALARRLPGLLPRGARVLDLGAGCGFLGAHLATGRPDLTLTLHEADPGLAQTLARVLAENHLAPGPMLTLAEGAAPPAIAAHRPQALLLGDPGLAPDGLADLLPGLAPQPRLIALHGRWLECHHTALTALEALLEDLGYTAQTGFDPAQARVWRLD
jgi:hypothetical protein